MTEQLHFHFSLSCIGGGNGNPLQCSCLENPREGGTWWAAIYGVAHSQTQLKWLSSSSSSSLYLSSWTKDLENINSFKLHQPPEYHIGIQWWIRMTVWETKSYKLGVLNLGCTQDELACFKTGIIELWPASQIQPTTSFCMAHKLRKVFTFLNALKKWKDYFKHLQIIWNANCSVHK